MKTDASIFIIEVVLLQMGKDKKLHPVAFYSQKFSIIEINYKIHNKELLVIVNSFQEWHHFLEGALHPMIICINHKNLEYFMLARVLNHYQIGLNMPLS